jgi:nitrate reductase molybdenum cofactor assembly chaperone
METTKVGSSTYFARALGEALEYPNEGHRSSTEALRDGLAESTPEASKALSDYLNAIDGWTLAQLEEHYTRTFDITPSCPPYLSVHLFGVEANERTALMTGLAATYKEIGFSVGSELPDHLACLLEAAPHFEASEWSTMVEYVLGRGLPVMQGLLDMHKNPYSHLVRAVAHTVGVPTEKPCVEVCHG